MPPCGEQDPQRCKSSRVSQVQGGSSVYGFIVLFIKYFKSFIHAYQDSTVFGLFQNQTGSQKEKPEPHQCAIYSQSTSCPPPAHLPPPATFQPSFSVFIIYIVQDCLLAVVNRKSERPSSTFQKQDSQLVS